MANRIEQLAVALLVATAAHAHEGHAHHIRGTVTALEAKQVTVRAEGKTLSILLDQKTTYQKGVAPAAADDLKIGDRADITVSGNEGDLTATHILFSSSAGSPGTKAAPHHEVKP